MKISYDYDGVISTPKYKAKAMADIANGDTVYIISARSSDSALQATARNLKIPASRVYATGSNRLKVVKVKELNIDRHYDNNPDVIKELPGIGILIK